MNPIGPEQARMVVAMFGLDDRVRTLLERCTNVLHTGSGLSAVKELSDDVGSVPLVIDVGVAFLLNAVSRMLPAVTTGRRFGA